jgi:phosphatidylglycerophosphate synthase
VTDLVSVQSPAFQSKAQLLRFLLVSVLSGSRLLTGGMFVFLALDPSPELQRTSLCALVLLFFSDFLDGPLARRWKVTTRFGFVIDGLGDRAAYLSCLLVMNFHLRLPILFTYLIVMRDIILYAARSVQTSWDKHHSKTRWITKSHAGLLRIIFVLYFAPFYIEVFSQSSSLLRYRVPENWLVGAIIACTFFAYLSLWIILHGYHKLGYDLFQDT